MKKLELPAFADCLGGCGESIAIDIKGRRAKYRKRGGLYCRDCVRKLNSIRMKKSNPMDNQASREKAKKSLKLMGHHPKVLGGNGRGYTIAQKMLFQSLGRGWWMELVIPTGEKKIEFKAPTSYKVDVANIYYKLAIEVDGGTHTGSISREEDQRKEAFLKSSGWTVLRYLNHRILEDLDSVITEIMFTISKLK